MYEVTGIITKSRWGRDKECHVEEYVGHYNVSTSDLAAAAWKKDVNSTLLINWCILENFEL